jgi:uncharacterized protein (DUF302 family)
MPIPATPPGVVTVPSIYPVADTTALLADAATARGLTIFATIDFSGDAAAAGLSMHDARLLIVGNPKGGTPAMVACPLAALDLPLKLLVWADARGDVRVGYNAPGYLQDRYGLSDDLARPLGIVRELVSDALRPP